ncbi:hypothetical protein LTR37_020599 [Vermiconidia calcicola]|uniref:Uncharacterized protein n=1 Tax=Vermiconidia calcicola TaxID=1690605 RepID=A0ACC3MAS5_9PEZI|nr:hypothetical protein LTR37_020599 [Vermiconidia calcicola]
MNQPPSSLQGPASGPPPQASSQPRTKSAAPTRRSAAASQPSARPTATTTSADLSGMMASTLSLPGSTGQPSAARLARATAYGPKELDAAGSLLDLAGTSNRSRTSLPAERPGVVPPGVRQQAIAPPPSDAPLTSDQRVGEKRPASRPPSRSTSRPPVQTAPRIAGPAAGSSSGRTTGAQAQQALRPTTAGGLPSVVGGPSGGPHREDPNEPEVHLGMEEGSPVLVELFGPSQTYYRPHAFLPPLNKSQGDSEKSRYLQIRDKFRDYAGVLDYETRTDFKLRIRDRAARLGKDQTKEALLNGIHDEWASVAVPFGYTSPRERQAHRSGGPSEIAWAEEERRLKASNQSFFGANTGNHFNVPDHWRTTIKGFDRGIISRGRYRFAFLKAENDTRVLPYESRTTFVERQQRFGRSTAEQLNK